jgi:deoxyribodipyrimidine photo-lyase
MRSLVWFRSDLRTDDNPALNAAVEAGEEGVAALFLVCRDQWLDHDWGPSKVDFVLRSVTALEQSLDELNVPLIIQEVGTFVACAEAVAGVAEALGVDAVFANREYEINEARRDGGVAVALAKAGRSLRLFHDQTIVPPDRLRTQKGDPYSVFTPFWRAWVRDLEQYGLPLPAEPSGPLPKPLSLPPDIQTVPPPTLEVPQGIIDSWPAGEQEAMHRLVVFANDRIANYRDQRDLAAEAGTSRLSPYLAAGSISIRRCLEVALAANDGRLTDGEAGVDIWIKELAWRDFYRQVLVGFPRICKGKPFRRETEHLSWRDADSDFEAWCAGRTGIPFVDAGMRQLLATGWMHNRLRMVTAMFLTKNLLIDWRAGERFFNQHLVDADFASNNGGWQWSASTGTDAAPYFRIFNPWTQGKRYDPEGRYIRRWVPELAEVPTDTLHDPKKLAEVLGELDYPAPIVNLTASRARATAAFEAIKTPPGR